jgi:hypothetical protein
MLVEMFIFFFFFIWVSWVFFRKWHMWDGGGRVGCTLVLVFAFVSSRNELGNHHPSHRLVYL